MFRFCRRFKTYWKLSCIRSFYYRFHSWKSHCACIFRLQPFSVRSLKTVRCKRRKVSSSVSVRPIFRKKFEIFNHPPLLLQLQNLFQRPCLSREAAKRRLSWVGHIWKKNDSMIKTVIEEGPIGTRPQGIPRLRWENCAKRDVKAANQNVNWWEVAKDGKRWRTICYTGWF